MFPYWPRTIENRAALRTAVAALTAVLISFKFHLETPYWSGMSVVIVSNLYTGSIIDKAMMRITGTIAGAFLGYFIAGLVTNSFILFFITVFLIIVISVYYYNISKYGYAYLLGALCAFIIISQLAVNPQNAFFVAVWRPVEIGIGVLVSAISVYVIFPNHLKDNILTQVHDIFDDFSLEFEQLLQCLHKNEFPSEVLGQSNLKIKKKLRKAVELIGAMNREIGVSKEKTDEFRAFLDSFYVLSRQFQYLIITSPQEDDLTALQLLSIEPVFSAIKHDLRELQSAFSSQSLVPVVLKTTTAIEELEKQFDSRKSSYSVKSDFIYSFIHFLQQINDSFILMKSLLARVYVKASPQYQVLNKQERLRSDFDLMIHCIKAGLSVILALSFWMISNWPGGINGIISSLIISIRKNMFEMKNVSIHRILGCFLGGGTALLSLSVFEMNLFDFIWVFFVSVWLFSYWMFKSPKYSYIGLQANIALIIALAQKGGPPMLLDPPLQRLGGIFIGIIASFLVANILWRSDVWTILSRYLKKLYGYITFNINQVLSVEGNKKSLHDLANLFWLSRGIIESLANEHLNLKKQTLLQQLTQKFESLVVIQATISHILGTINREKAQVTGMKMGLDLPVVEQKLVQCYQEHDMEGALNLSQKFKLFTSDIENNPSYSNLEDAEIRNILAYVNALNQLATRVQKVL